MQPFVGMTVQYFPREADEGAKEIGKPLAAIVAAVWSDACVNLTVFDGNGRPYSNPNTSVTLYPHAALKDGHEPGCAYMLPANGMLESEIERIEEENERLSKSNQDLMCKLDESRQANSKRAVYLSEVCKILGDGPDGHAPTVAELAKAKIDQLAEDREGMLQDLRAICKAGGREYSGDAVRVMVERLKSLRPASSESEQLPGVSPALTESGSDRDQAAERTFLLTKNELMIEPPRTFAIKYRAHAKVMRSYDYNHFEISLSCDDLQGLDEVDDLRKDAARLAEKAVDQYQKQQAFETWKINNRQPDNLSREAQEIIGNRPESEWTPAEKAKVKRYRDRQYWINRVYDYEDEFDWESEREEDEIPV